MKTEEQHILIRETARFASGRGRGRGFDKASRYAMFVEVMESESRSLGFSRDTKKSRSGYSVFSKPVSEGWDLCWTIEDMNTFHRNVFEGQFEPYLHLRARNVRGKLNRAQMGEFLVIRYRYLILGFGNAYWKFSDLNQLETIIKAHLRLYALLAPGIESGIARALRGTFH
jgi:hypothetical protein